MHLVKEHLICLAKKLTIRSKDFWYEVLYVLRSTPYSMIPFPNLPIVPCTYKSHVIIDLPLSDYGFKYTKSLPVPVIRYHCRIARYAIGFHYIICTY